MENIALQLTNTHIYQRQKEIRQDVDRARFSSGVFFNKMKMLFSSLELRFKGTKISKDKRHSRHLLKRRKIV